MDADEAHYVRCEEGPGPDCARCSRIVAEREELERHGVEPEPKVVRHGPFRETR